MRPPKNPHLKAAIEVGFIIFLFYSNLLMGEFTRTTGRDMTLLVAIANIVTVKNFAIALFTSVIGHLGFDILRKKS
jgi:uncharacterized protein with PQ loop repeat